MYDLKRTGPQDCDYGCGSDKECKSYEAECETECNGIYQDCIAAHKSGKVEKDPCLAGYGVEMCYLLLLQQMLDTLRYRYIWIDTSYRL